MLHPVPYALQTQLVPLLGRLLPAGFPSPADDYLDGEIDLAAYLIERPAASFLMRVSGESMKGAGILDGDLVVVDRSLRPQSGQVVVGVCDGEMTLKRLRRLARAAPCCRPRTPTSRSSSSARRLPAEIWGVVVGIVRKLG